MASLVKDSKGRSKFWICCYTTADGRRLKKSTKQTVHAKALEMCLGLERAEKLAAQKTLTEARARELIGEVFERANDDTLTFFTAEAWLRQWLSGKKVSKSEGTFTKYSSTIENFLTHLGKRANLNIAAITSKDIAGYRDAEIASGKNPNTVHYLVKQLRIPFNAARRQGLLTHNPAESVELPGKLKGEDGGDATRDVFTPEQIQALLTAAVAEDEKSRRPFFEAGKEWRGAILFAYYTGARLQDVANFIWSGVDLPAKTVTYRAKKTGKLVTIPMHPELETYLISLTSPDSGKAFVFPSLAGKGTGGRSGLSLTFSKIMARAKVVGEVLRKAEKGSKGRTVRSLTFHSLRHSFNSAMANAGVSQEIRMKLTGHMSVDMNKGYTHLELDPLRAAISAIPNVTGKKDE